MKPVLIAVASACASVTCIGAALAQPAPALTRQQVAERAAERFARFDANRDGQVTRAEFDAARAGMKAEREAGRGQRRQALFARLDTDRSGQLSPAEFAARPAGDRPHGGHGRGGMAFGGRGGAHGDWFGRLDADRDGRVSQAEAQAPALARFDRADANRDGSVTPEERRAAREAAPAR